MKVLFITMGQYPNNDAASQRLHLLSKMLVQNGHEVEVLSRNKQMGSGSLEKVYFKSLYAHSRSTLGIIKNYTIDFSIQTKAEIEHWRPKVIVLISAPTPFASWLIRHQSKYNYYLFHDSVEWYSKEEYRHPLLSFEYLKKQIWMKYILPKRFNVIAISLFLKNYFEKQGNKCIRIPSVCDSSSITCNNAKKTNSIVITYAGSPGRKDNFKEIIGAILLLDEESRKKIQFHIIGASIEQIAINSGFSCDEIKRLSNVMVFYDRMSREEVYNHLVNSDYSILIRNEKARFAQAGFPTKVPESMAAGTPVICNLTSDLGLYLNDHNSIIVEQCTITAVLNALKKIIDIDYKELLEMKNNARKTAIQCFDYTLYSATLNNFINEVVDNGTF